MPYVAVRQSIVEGRAKRRLVRRSHINDVLMRTRRAVEALATPVRQPSRRDHRRLRLLPVFKHASPIRSPLARRTIRSGQRRPRYYVIVATSGLRRSTRRSIIQVMARAPPSVVMEPSRAHRARDQQIGRPTATAVPRSWQGPRCRQLSHPKADRARSGATTHPRAAHPRRAGCPDDRSTGKARGVRGRRARWDPGRKPQRRRRRRRGALAEDRETDHLARGARHLRPRFCRLIRQRRSPPRHDRCRRRALVRRRRTAGSLRGRARIGTCCRKKVAPADSWGTARWCERIERAGAVEPDGVARAASVRAPDAAPTGTSSSAVSAFAFDVPNSIQTRSPTTAFQGRCCGLHGPGATHRLRASRGESLTPAGTQAAQLGAVRCAARDSPAGTQACVRPRVQPSHVRELCVVLVAVVGEMSVASRGLIIPVSVPSMIVVVVLSTIG